MSEENKKAEYKEETCKYEFTPEELRDIAETLAIKTQDLEKVEDEKKSVMSSYKDRIDKIGIDIKQAARLYKDRFEMRQIECEVFRNYEDGVVIYIRTDNGEVARTSKMTMGERQMHIDQAIKDEAKLAEPLTEEQEREAFEEYNRAEGIAHTMRSERSSL